MERVDRCCIEICSFLLLQKSPNFLKISYKIDFLMQITFVDEISDAGTSISRKVSDDDKMESVIWYFLDDVSGNTVAQIEKIWSYMMFLDHYGGISLIGKRSADFDDVFIIVDNDCVANEFSYSDSLCSVVVDWVHILN